MKRSGNTILITGGTSGIGLALAKAFRAKGNDIPAFFWPLRPQPVRCL